MLISIGGYSYWRFRSIGTTVMPLRMGQYEPGELLIRRVSKENDTLLIGVLDSADMISVTRGRADAVPSGSVYRFTPKLYHLEPATLDDWKEATGPITFRYFDEFRETKPVEVNPRTGVLSAGETPLRTAGAYDLDKDVSPDRQFVNVISANGSIGKGNFLFFLGGGGGAYPLGPFYHEVFDRISGAKVGDTYTLKDPWERVSLSFCWESEGRYVVYYDMQGRFLWVVPVPKSTGAKP